MCYYTEEKPSKIQQINRLASSWIEWLTSDQDDMSLNPRRNITLGSLALTVRKTLGGQVFCTLILFPSLGIFLKGINKKRSLIVRRTKTFSHLFTQLVLYGTHSEETEVRRRNSKDNSHGRSHCERAVFGKMKMDPAKQAQTQNAGEVSSLQWFFSQSIELMTDKVWLHCIRLMLLK